MAAVTMQAGVLGLVHNPHSAAAEFLNDAVVRDGLADHWRKSYVRQREQVNETREVGGVSKRLLL